MTYKAWREAVIRILTSQKLITPEREVSDDIYYHYYEDGYSPVKAVKADLGEDCIKYFNGMQIVR